MNSFEEKLKNLSPDQLDSLKNIYEEFKDCFGEEATQEAINIMPPMKVINFDRGMPSIIAGFFLASLKWDVGEILVKNRINKEVKKSMDNSTVIALDNAFLIEIMGIMYGLSYTYAVSQIGIDDSELRLLVLDTVKAIQLTTYEQFMYYIDRFTRTIRADKLPGYDSHLQNILYNVVFLNYNAIDDLKIMGIDAYNEGKKKHEGDNNEQTE